MYWVNDPLVPKYIKSNTKMFADNGKLYSEVRRADNVQIIKIDLIEMSEWVQDLVSTIQWGLM